MTVTKIIPLLVYCFIAFYVVLRPRQIIYLFALFSPFYDETFYQLFFNIQLFSFNLTLKPFLFLLALLVILVSVKIVRERKFDFQPFSGYWKGVLCLLGFYAVSLFLAF
jgi:hypothetical protein